MCPFIHKKIRLFIPISCCTRHHKNNIHRPFSFTLHVPHLPILFSSPVASVPYSIPRSPVPYPQPWGPCPIWPTCKSPCQHLFSQWCFSQVVDLQMRGLCSTVTVCTMEPTSPLPACTLGCLAAQVPACLPDRECTLDVQVCKPMHSFGFGL